MYRKIPGNGALHRKALYGGGVLEVIFQFDTGNLSGISRWQFHSALMNRAKSDTIALEAGQDRSEPVPDEIGQVG